MVLNYSFCCTLLVFFFVPIFFCDDSSQELRLDFAIAAPIFPNRKFDDLGWLAFIFLRSMKLLRLIRPGLTLHRFHSGSSHRRSVFDETTFCRYLLNKLAIVALNTSWDPWDMFHPIRNTHINAYRTCKNIFWTATTHQIINLTPSKTSHPRYLFWIFGKTKKLF